MTGDPYTSPPIGPDSIVGRYKVISHLAFGGMSEIFLARDTSVSGISRNVVLKCIHPEILEDPSVVELFVDEIRIVARLSHENIAHVYDFGESNGTYFMAMEHVEGLSLRQLALGQLPEYIPIEHLVKIGADVAQALYYAHTLKDDDGKPVGIIHRDVSPQNILVSFDGQVKLVDFGVAKAADQLHHTQVGTLRGKCSYMAPEQCLELPMDHRVDIFALGIVLHELLSGRRLFKRETAVETIRAICVPRIPRPSELHPEVPRSLDDVVLKALARKPDDRYQSADEMSVALTRVAQEEGLVSNPVYLGRFVRSVRGVESSTASPSASDRDHGSEHTDSDDDSIHDDDEVTDVDAVEEGAPTPKPTPPAPSPPPGEDTTSVNNLLPIGAPTTVVSGALASISALEKLYPYDPASDIDVPTLVSDPPADALLTAMLESDLSPDDAALELEAALSLESGTFDVDLTPFSLDDDWEELRPPSSGLERARTKVDRRSQTQQVDPPDKGGDSLELPELYPEETRDDPVIAALRPNEEQGAPELPELFPDETRDDPPIPEIYPTEDHGAQQIPELYPDEDQTSPEVRLPAAAATPPTAFDASLQQNPAQSYDGLIVNQAIGPVETYGSKGFASHPPSSRAIFWLAIGSIAVVVIFGVVFLATLLLSGCH